MKDLELTATLRNNQLKERRLALGLTQRELARAAGVGLGNYAGLETLRIRPVTGEHWTRDACRLADFYEVQPEVIFPACVLGVVESRVVHKLDADDLRRLSAHEEERLRLLAPSTADTTVRRELHREIGVLLATLTPREEKVVRMRFGIGEKSDHTLEEVGQEFGVRRESIRQIEARALRKLRHPSRSRSLRPFVVSGLDDGERGGGAAPPGQGDLDTERLGEP